MKYLEVYFTPADFAGLVDRPLRGTVCVVFDVFRATSSIVTALANGAAAVIPAGEISEALALRERDPAMLLAGERHGLRIRAELSGGVEFDFGNSPREFTRERVEGRTLACTTTNGTRALRACAHADTVLIASFLNLTSTADRVRRMDPENLLLVCSGTFEQAALEDVLGAGALCDLLWNEVSECTDSAVIARQIFDAARDRLLETASTARNGRRLLANADLRDDVPFCLRRDVCPFAAVLGADGAVRRAPDLKAVGQEACQD